MMTISRIIICSWIVFLAGCAITPSHSPSAISSPKMTRNGIKVVNSTHDFSAAMWWKRMHDPVLNRLISEALAKNNQVHTAEANILQAQAKLRQARFAWLPTLSASGNGFIGGGWDSQITPKGALAQSGLFSQVGNVSFHGYYGGFVPSYSLNVFENIYNNKFAAASLAMQQAVYQSTKLSIISQMSGAYFMLLGQKEQFREQSQLIQDLKNVRRLEWLRYKDGGSDLSTVINFDQQIVNQQASLSSIENSIAQVENAIQILINRNPGPLVAHGDINKLSLRGLIPAKLPSAVLKNRPDVIIAKDNLKMAEASLGLAYSNFFPTISLTGLLGGVSIELAHLLSLSTGLWVAQAAASMPVLNGGMYQQIKADKAGYRAAYYSYIQTVKSAFADVDNSLTNQQKMNNVYESKLQALQASKKLYGLVLARYNAGARDYRDVANAAVNVDYAKLDLNQAKMQQLDSIVEVYQALAGGYRACIG